MSAQKSPERAEIETFELLGGTEGKRVSPMGGG